MKQHTEVPEDWVYLRFVQYGKQTFRYHYDAYIRSSYEVHFLANKKHF
jgi:hypothetical protein